MNKDEICVFRKFQKLLIRYINHEQIINTLVLHNVFPYQQSQDILTALNSGQPGLRLLTSILLELPQHCTSESFLAVLKDCDRSLYQRYRKRLKKRREEQSSTAIALGPLKHKTTITNPFLDRFHELLKARTLRAGELRWKKDFELWACKLSQRLHSAELPYWEKYKIADCTYILLDLTAVLEKQHEPNKEILATSPVFNQIESIIMHTSDPTLYRLTFNARKGVALAHAGKLQSAMNYARMVLKDANCFTNGRQIGNSIFAVVNILLQYYASFTLDERSVTGNELKKEILFWIETGIKHFENENEDMRRTWRRVYLDKKVFCHLGLDILSRDIPGVEITAEDVQIARESLVEMEKLKQGMENMRLIHYYVAEAKLHKLLNERPISDGYLKQALEIGQNGHYLSEVDIINSKIHGFDSWHQTRQPVENDEDSTPTVKESPSTENRTPCENAESLETKYSCSMEISISSSETTSPNMNVNDDGDKIVENCVEVITNRYL